MSEREQKQYVYRLVFVSIIVLIHISPLIIVVLNSLRSNNEVALRMIGLPTKLNWENFAYAWKKGSYANAYISTVIIAITSAVIVVISTGLAAYGIVKSKCYLSGFLTGYFVVALSIPYFAMMVPVFFVFHRIGLTNSIPGMIILYSATNIPFNFMFVLAFFKGLPKELDEAARIDGCSELRNFWYNTLPLSKPILTSVVLIVFVNCWNEFLFANLFLQTNKLRTVALRFFVFTGQYSSDYGYMFAAALISILPIIAGYLLMQNRFIEGLTAGSVKG
jgi:raffinose/stachyose/melibiose transport system permease protein